MSELISLISLMCESLWVQWNIQVHLNVFLVLYTENTHSEGSAISDFTFPECSYIVNHVSFFFFFFLLLVRFISYPRTETNIFPPNLALTPLVEQQTHSPVWGAFAQRVLDQPGGPNPRQGKNSDQAHPPIHPTKFTNALQVSLTGIFFFISIVSVL